MATLVRRPLTTFQLPPNFSPVHMKTTTNRSTTMAPISGKRPRSPDGRDAQRQADSKRSKCIALSPLEDRKEKEKRKVTRDAANEEFRLKYTKAFPSWTFYFDTPDWEKETLAARVTQLNGRIAKFFSNEVTHFITNQPLPSSDNESNKENVPKEKSGLHDLLKSPIKLRERVLDDNTLIRKAVQLRMKIWDPAKLDSVLERCAVPAPAQSLQAKLPVRSLTNLLESERRFGATSERDPTQRRHDYHYFSKYSRFVLVEDMRQELATIAVAEYPITRTADGKEKGDWPVLHCHPLARGPFHEYNEKEERRREKLERAEKEREEQRRLELRKLKARKEQSKQMDLRRTVSMNNLFGQAAHGEETQGCESGASATASGYIASMGTGDYVAASGNSVGITSTYGTTSTNGAGSSRRVSQSLLPTALRDRLQNQVLTSRKVSVGPGSVGSAFMAGNGDKDQTSASTTSAMMPPPAQIPERRRALLRKSKSTNTIRLAKRDETSKPGYCESCRVKFEDFKTHVQGRRHRKFATNEANFLQLDYALSRVKRRTIEEVENEDSRDSDAMEDVDHEDDEDEDDYDNCYE